MNVAAELVERAEREIGEFSLNDRVPEPGWYG